jgi:hypothetical protein
MNYAWLKEYKVHQVKCGAFCKDIGNPLPDLDRQPDEKDLNSITLRMILNPNRNYQKRWKYWKALTQHVEYYYKHKNFPVSTFPDPSTPSGNSC